VISHQPPPPSVCCDGSLFVPQPCRAMWLWVLLTGAGDEPYGPPPALLQAAAYQQPAVSTPVFPAICLLIVHTEISSLLFLPSLVSFQQPHNLCHGLVFSSLLVWCWWLVVAAHLFSQWNVVWRSLPQARVSRCWCFDSPWCFTSAKHVSRISARSLIHGAHTVCLCAPVAIWDLLVSFLLNVVIINPLQIF
jgi:hypothetical protein